MTNEIEVILADYERANENGLGQAACARLIAALREAVVCCEGLEFDNMAEETILAALRGDES